MEKKRGRKPGTGLKGRSIKVAPLVKVKTEELKKTLGVESQSEAIAYLLHFYAELFPKMTHMQHQQFMDAAKETQSTPVLNLQK